MDTKKRERDHLVCELYKADVPVTTIASRAKISLGTLYAIIKRNGIELRQEQNQENRNKAVEVICNYFDLGVSPESIAGVLNTETRNILLVLKKYRYDSLQKYMKRIKIQEAIGNKTSKNKETDPAFANNSLQGLLKRQQEQHLEKKHPELDYGAHIQRALEGKKGITKEETRDKHIAKEYASGASIKQILSQFDVSQEYIFYLIEADNSKPVPPVK